MVNGLGSIYEIDSSITQYQHLLATSSRSDPRRIFSLFKLAVLRYQRYDLSNQSEDIDKSIFHLAELILLQPRSLELGRMILPSLFIIVAALVMRSKASNQPEGVIHAAKYLRYLRDHPHGVSGLSRQAVTAFLVDALACQVELEARNVMQRVELEEMAVLCYELLTLEASDDHTTSSITCFALAVLLTLSKTTIAQAECARGSLLPRSVFMCRFTTTFVNDDYEEAASAVDELIASDPAGDSIQVQERMAELAILRSMAYSTPEYSEEAIYRAQVTAAQRFRFFGSIEGPETSSGNSRPVPAVYLGNPDPEMEKVKLIEELHSEIRNSDMTEIGEAVEKARTLLASAPTAFLRTNKIEYLDESISTLRQIYDHPSPHFLRFEISEDLSASYLARLIYFPGHRTQDLDEIMELFSQCANNARASLPIRFQYSCIWAFIARGHLHPSVSKAYESAVSLMQDALRFAPTLQQQHATLAKPFFNIDPVSLDYASYQVDLHRLEEAVETLERGRALLWSEMRHLRASIDQLQQENPQLGHEFAAINKDLEELTMSIPPSHKLRIDDDAADNSRADDLRAVDPFGHLLLKQRELLKERNNLTSRIRALPGFNSFLTSPSFNTIRSAASSGPSLS
ncbi:hypothetical protein EDB92DRAFT_2114518 [Lactarius akahatsu]|uniref:Uncharacterized protein n=1 Tax=Lactarius akahatsu TaxID=416441 RepID=A0AAD4LGI5_9AGAM|nr:hypothetical protein EDB92DRAFT_2114518 [Lactarius akahatsu]